MAKPRRCTLCDKPLPAQHQGAVCAECHRQESQDQGYNLPDRPDPTFDPPPPPLGVHIAGPVEDRIQRCTRCKAVIATEKRTRRNTVPFTRYPEGALIERGRGWQAMSLRIDAQPDCQEAVA